VYVRHDAAEVCSCKACGTRPTCASAARQIGGLAREDDYEYLGQDGFCRDRKHGGDADAALTQLKVRRETGIGGPQSACSDRASRRWPVWPALCGLRAAL
jgi:hypothetical protein